MAWTDRDYYRGGGAPRYSMSRLRALSVTTWLIIINVGVFVIDALLARAGYGYTLVVDHFVVGRFSPLEFWGHFSWWYAIHELQLWRFITFQFLHGSLMHLGFNMLGLYFFGPLIEQYLGARRYLAFYLVSGMAGAAGYLVLSALGLLITSPLTPLVGASAGIFGILIAGAYLAPNAMVMLFFPPIPMSLKTLAWVLIGIGVFTIVMGGQNAGGQAAHLGGALVGYVLIRNTRWLRFADWLQPSNWRRRRMRYRAPDDNWTFR